MQQISVLLADAQPIFRQGIRALLEREQDIEVVGDTGDGAEVMSLVKRLLPRVVVMDVQLPDHAGIQLAKDIRQSCSQVEILVLTTYSHAFHVLGMLRAGARGYILKQSAEFDLADSIRKVNHGDPVLDPVVVNTVLDDVHQPKTRSNAGADLTLREHQIIELIAAGKTSREIAAEMGLSPKTVDNIRAQVLQKLHARNKIEAITTALEHGMLHIASSARSRTPPEQ